MHAVHAAMMKETTETMERFTIVVVEIPWTQQLIDRINLKISIDLFFYLTVVNFLFDWVLLLTELKMPLKIDESVLDIFVLLLLPRYHQACLTKQQPPLRMRLTKRFIVLYSMKL
jgi:hypothetical protein